MAEDRYWWRSPVMTDPRTRDVHKTTEPLPQPLICPCNQEGRTITVMVGSQFPSYERLVVKHG